MELIIDSSNIEAIRQLNELLTITGITTNPSIITKSGKDPSIVIQELTDILKPEQLLFTSVLRLCRLL